MLGIGFLTALGSSVGALRPHMQERRGVCCELGCGQALAVARGYSAPLGRHPS